VGRGVELAQIDARHVAPGQVLLRQIAITSYVNPF
jgi:hypothetical protein